MPVDDLRFDCFTKTLATPNTRRGVLGGLAAALIGLAGLRGADAAACRQAGASCNQHADCCTGQCGPKDTRGRRTCACARGEKYCNGRCIPEEACCSDRDCGDNHSCLNGGCFRSDGTCYLGCGGCVSTVTIEGDVACSGIYINGPDGTCYSTDDCPIGAVCAGDIDSGYDYSYCFFPCEITAGEVSVAC
jgi:hypothetical protein